VLNDMDVEGSFFETYKHEYKIIEEVEDGKPEETISAWYEVDEKKFNLHVNDMGMEVASRGKDGKLHKGATPPGYNNYVGNEKYGHWQTNNGNSFWAFYGQYAFMSSMFRMSMYPAYRSHYNDYRGNYYGTGRSYYGPTAGGSSYYGTNSAYTNSTRPNSSWSKNNSSFKQNVAGRTSRSSSRFGGTTSKSSGSGFGK
ncbi:MAG: hypothetical protein NWS46_01840, partial [Cyclobacteriaceae bacterium]|nr:hypothetical protein [Cyclobacteriaceae bacterium]